MSAESGCECACLEGGAGCLCLPRIPWRGIFIGTCVLSRSTQAAAARSLGFQKSPGSPVAGPCIMSVELASLWPPGTHRNRFERQGKRHRDWGGGGRCLAQAVQGQSIASSWAALVSWSTCSTEHGAEGTAWSFSGSVPCQPWPLWAVPTLPCLSVWAYVE